MNSVFSLLQRARVERAHLLFFAIPFAAACGDVTTPTSIDAGADTTSDSARDVSADTQTADRPDNSVQDAFVADGASGCSPTQQCLRFASDGGVADASADGGSCVCVEACGGSVDALAGALDPRHEVLGNYCYNVGLSGFPFTITGSGANLSDYQIWILRTSGEADGHRFTVSRASLNAQTLSATMVATAMHTEPSTDAGMMPTYAGGYLVLNPSATRGLFGFTTNGNARDGIFEVNTGSMTVSEVAAAGNESAVFINDTDYLVNGFGVDDVNSGNGVYLRRAATPMNRKVATNSGAFSGAVALLTLGATQYAIIGGSDFPIDRVFATPLDDLLNATDPVDLGTHGGTRRTTPVTSRFRSVAPDTIALRPYTGDVVLITLQPGTPPSWGSEVRVGSGNVFFNISQATPGTLLLQHANGFLHVRTR